MNIRDLRKRLTRTSIEDRIPVIREYLEGLNETERQKYREFYYVSIKTLKQSRGVTRAKIRLSGGGYFIFGAIPYYTLHQIACVATEHLVRTPKQELQNNGIKTKQTIRKPRQGKRISRLMEQKPAKVRLGPKPADRYDKTD